jgi:hypothetical protein
MGAYNDVNCRAPCPQCCVETALILQIHTASSFAGDDTGRFCMRAFSVGDKLPWWPPSHPKFSTWYDCVEVDDVLDLAQFSIKERAYGSFSNCNAEFYATVSIREFVIESVENIRLERILS